MFAIWIFKQFFDRGKKMEERRLSEIEMVVDWISVKLLPSEIVFGFT